MNSLKTLTGVVLILSSFSTFAVDSVDLKLVGRFKPKNICMPSFSNGGVLDYGVIREQELDSSSYTILPDRQINFSIICNSPTMASFKLVSGSPDSLDSTRVVNGFGEIGPVWGGTGYGIHGTGIGFDASGNKIGAMAMNIKQGNVTADGALVDILRVRVRNGLAASYAIKPDGETLTGASNPMSESEYFEYTVSTGGSLFPNKPFTGLEALVDVAAYLNKKDNLDLTTSWGFNGLVTFEMVYR